MKNSKKHWFFSSSSRSRSRSSSSVPASDEAPPPPPPPLKPGRPSPETYPGCMAMMHYIMFAPGAGCVGRPPSSSHAAADVATNAASPLSPAGEAGGGIQAPRNSLDLDTDPQLRRDIQIGVQIEPAFDTLMARSSRRPSAAPSEAETPRTPSLVARLMGIDGLPDPSSSPSPASEKKKRVIPESISLRQRQPLISRSLPDTPRASTSSARPTAPPTWDVVDHPRLSLQVLKDIVHDRAAQYMSMPTSPTSLSGSGGPQKKKNTRRRDAAEIVRQAKETVTNRKSKIKNAIGKENASPVHHQCVKENAPPAAKPAAAAPATRAPLADLKQPHAPRLPQHRVNPSRPPPPPPPLDPPPQRAAAPAPAAVKCKRPDGCERFATRIKKPAQQQPSSPASSTEYRDIVVVSGERNVAATGPAEEENPEYVYLRRVLERGGFMRSGTAAAARRPLKVHSVATPVDPLVFHLLELELPAEEEEARQLGPLRHRWNRKLLFHLTQEMLAEQLLGLDPTATATSSSSEAEAEAVVARLWRWARSFPAADCKDMEDVLALVALDVEAAAASRRLVERRLLAEEADDVKDDVADQLLDALLHDLCLCLSARC